MELYLPKFKILKFLCELDSWCNFLMSEFKFLCRQFGVSVSKTLSFGHCLRRLRYRCSPGGQVTLSLLCGVERFHINFRLSSENHSSLPHSGLKHQGPIWIVKVWLFCECFVGRPDTLQASKGLLNLASLQSLCQEQVDDFWVKECLADLVAASRKTKSVVQLFIQADC